MNTAELLNRFGFSGFRQGQEQVVERILGGGSALAVFPTGAGKSLCYQLPALALPGLTVVISPLIALMKDQEDFLKGKGIPAARLDSTLTREESRRIIGEAMAGTLKILMVSVERLRNEIFREQLKRMNLSLLVVDEAHCISEWGHNFRPDYLKIPEYKALYQIPQVLLLTATATPRVSRDICEKFGMGDESVVRTGFFRPNLHLRMMPAASFQEKRQALLGAMRDEPGGPAIVYTTLQKGAESVAAFLTESGFPCEAYHAGLAPDVRASIQNRFMEGALPTVAATIAFGMGIDKSDIRKVIHFDPPKSIEGYSQEIGRAGRDGNLSACTLIGSREGIHTLENFVYGDTPSKESILTLISEIASHPERNWEVRQFELSKHLDMRPLPLKTLLVYLELFGVIKPVRVFFESYAFKYERPKETIIGAFQGERRAFVEAVFALSADKKVWSYPDMQAIGETTGSPRERILSALTWFEEQGMITLKQGRAVDVFEILQQQLDVPALAERLHDLFSQKEVSEVARIHQVLDLADGTACLAQALSAYFGEPLASPCGSCSVCTGDHRPIPAAPGVQDLSLLRLQDVAGSFVSGLSNRDPRLIAKFLCGIPSPSLSRTRGEKGFAALETEPFHEVMAWCEREIGDR
ncbi:RecQ family ATP-dependent DNA helicase [Desulfoluna spongiiphila]|uniref:ATP-dependent DNA helicase RecQ n=1 Tax=Desulfoluna spongiiphila TaxID=419481 RepID=A0A1G5CU29_9BACT|nr:RecQ family ATP-dependent DNA helicase [Desulfoluna spongiiphila]SCY05912.1 ATP-dependent DNA helicase, RecQ-like [Desulfoluna spongiiphila]